jgi:5-methylcytosine-specific restriction endonuclease McrA
MRKVPAERVDINVHLKMQKYQCNDCGDHVVRTAEPVHNQAHLDHIKPLSRGGHHTYENTQVLCRRCNMRKSDIFEDVQGNL